MISKEDALGYLNEMLKLEYQMKASYKELAPQVTDSYYKDNFLKMIDEEQSHADLVNKIIELLKKEK